MLDKETYNHVHAEINKRWKYFTLFDMIRSNTAQHSSIDNTLPSDLLENAIFQLDCLDELRKQYGHAILITSGYRCKELNRLVGGATRSKHLTAEAVDIVPYPTRWNNDKFRKLLKYFLYHSDIPFNKMIVEPTWLHIEFSTENKRIVI